MNAIKALNISKVVLLEIDVQPLNPVAKFHGNVILVFSYTNLEPRHGLTSSRLGSHIDFIYDSICNKWFKHSQKI